MPRVQKPFINWTSKMTFWTFVKEGLRRNVNLHLKFTFNYWEFI